MNYEEEQRTSSCPDTSFPDRPEKRSVPFSMCGPRPRDSRRRRTIVTSHKMTRRRFLRGLWARSDINAVLIATGDRWHALASVMAAKAGKDVYCEKPMSLTIAEGRTVADTMRTLGRGYQGGTQRRG